VHCVVEEMIPISRVAEICVVTLGTMLGTGTTTWYDQCCPCSKDREKSGRAYLQSNINLEPFGDDSTKPSAPTENGEGRRDAITCNARAKSPRD